ncbi:MAG: sugar transferase [Rhizobiales bacterium]|nr:sugar transferase [Hyphomicrobiales bacterium]NRB13166.1 sugar transferase [Hyphomicrobiales bacterium]
MAYLNKKIEQVESKSTKKLKYAGYRAFDLIISASGLLLLSPLMISIAIMVKLDSKGPVFFRQKRYGLHRKTFEILKFRTMTVSSGESEFSQCVTNDSRVTRVGGFLRKFSLDELAQLYNVFRGDMSIVGPRPHAVEMDETYIKTLSNYGERFKTKPGITGLAQIRGFRGPTDTRKKILDRLQSDCEYISKKSLTADMRIIWLTLPALYKPQNAF